MVIQYLPYTGPIVTRAEAKAAGLKRYFMGPDRPCRRHGHVSERTTSDGQCIACTHVTSMSEEQLLKERRRIKVRDDKNRGALNEKARKRRREVRANMTQDEKSAAWRANYERWRPSMTASVRRWQAKNKEYLRIYRALHKDEEIANARRRNAENPEIRRGDARRWRERYPEKVQRWRKNNPEAARAIKHRRRARQNAAEGSHTADELRTLFTDQNGKCVYCEVALDKGYCADHIVPLASGGSNWISNIQLLCRSCNAKKWATDPDEYARRLRSRKE